MFGLGKGKAKPRVPVALLISLVIGLAVAGGTGMYLKDSLANTSETIEVAVPARNIPPYHTITASDLTWRTIAPQQREPNTVVTPDALVGKVARVTLYKSEQIRRERLAGPNLLAGYEFVTVNIDLARSGGASPGDIVDVYALTMTERSSWVLGKKKPVARNAIVLDLWDGQGNRIDTATSGVGLVEATTKALSAGGNKPPAVARLAVRPQDVSGVVPGAAAGSQTSIVLVVKNKQKPVENERGAFSSSEEMEAAGRKDQELGNRGGEAGAGNGTEQAQNH
ncbi:MAG: flagella basal body P-ring formation protein FlgA [Peptococcaceae bacterium]|nr:flagella basal body P-ring formation protein FlgA [Peptococcaceae bacterium]